MHLRAVIMNPSLYDIFEQFVVVSKVLHEEVSHFLLKAIRLNSLHENNYFSLAVHIVDIRGPICGQIPQNNVIFDVWGKM